MKDNRTHNDATEAIDDIIDRLAGGEQLRIIRDALSKRQAAVMIGSGFSRNAQGGDRLPLWPQLIEHLLSDLYSSKSSQDDARPRFQGTSGMLRLAEEYAAVLGRGQLEARMHEVLPDAGSVFPGQIHTDLLALAWNDVFTTNYDTLLERTLDADRGQFIPVIKQRYQVVVAAQDVPFSRRNGRPRLVKLHGSLRTGTRLIVSEEDYRRYPQDFGAFVNTVQQSMLENVFVLIGFSGDDPNFLAWTGWARDHLGNKAPPLYFITTKKLSAGERILLSQRKIFPIEIGELGQDNGKIVHSNALAKVIDYWKEKPIVRRAEWPYRNAGVELGNSTTPTLADLLKWLPTVQRNRLDFPGWLIAPANNRERLLNQSGFWRALGILEKYASVVLLN